MAVSRVHMPRSQKRRSSAERVTELEQKIAELKAKKAAQQKKSDPVLREIQKLQKILKRFIQLAHDNNRPDIANSAMGFRSMLERVLVAELKPEPTSEAETEA